MIPDDRSRLHQCELFEPQFVGLVYDDVQHLVMILQAGLHALGALSAEDLIQLQVIAVVNLLRHSLH